MQCTEFILALEDHLACHPGPAGAEPPLRLRDHAEACWRCRDRWHTAAGSRLLLAELREPAQPTELPPYFLTRLRAEISRQSQPLPRGFRGLRIAARDLVVAALLFTGALGSFLYNFQRTERPNADEAMVLDVPHLNPAHPADDHIRPRNADVMLSLMNP